jgi:uncharacterized LabA/DUF88 family protein
MIIAYPIQLMILLILISFSLFILPDGRRMPQAYVAAKSRGTSDMRKSMPGTLQSIQTHSKKYERLMKPLTLTSRAAFRISMLAATGKRPAYAVLVDAKSANPSSLSAIVKELGALGADAKIRRVYGNFDQQEEMKPWKEAGVEYKRFRPVNASSYMSGKGSVEAIMIIEAMVLLYGDVVDGFAIVSSDNDFSPLAQRLGEGEKNVIGFGERQTPSPFVTACKRFMYTEDLGQNKLKAEAKPKTKPSTPEWKEALRTVAIHQIQTLDQMNQVLEDKSDDGGWIPLSRLISITVGTAESDLDLESYGYLRWLELFELQPQYFELRVKNDAIEVRRKVL